MYVYLHAKANLIDNYSHRRNERKNETEMRDLQIIIANNTHKNH